MPQDPSPNLNPTTEELAENLKAGLEALPKGRLPPRMRCDLWRSNGFASSSVVGRTPNPTTRRSICSLCAGEGRCSRMLLD